VSITGSAARATNWTDPCALVVFNAALTSADATLIACGLASSYSMVTASVTNVVIQGVRSDSSTAGVVGLEGNYNKALNPISEMKSRSSCLPSFRLGDT
jgi:hypothetical protein